MAGAGEPTYQQLTDMKYLNCVLKVRRWGR
jgi:hypothetical protein